MKSAGWHINSEDRNFASKIAGFWAQSDEELCDNHVFELISDQFLRDKQASYLSIKSFKHGIKFDDVFFKENRYHLYQKISWGRLMRILFPPDQPSQGAQVVVLQH